MSGICGVVETGGTARKRSDPGFNIRTGFERTQVKLGTSEAISSVEFRRFPCNRIPIQISSDEFRSVPMGSVDFQQIPGGNFAEFAGTFPAETGPEPCHKKIVGTQRSRPKTNGIYRIRCRQTKQSVPTVGTVDLGNRTWIRSSLGDTGTAWKMTNGLPRSTVPTVGTACFLCFPATDPIDPVCFRSTPLSSDNFRTTGFRSSFRRKSSGPRSFTLDRTLSVPNNPDINPTISGPES